MGLLPLISFSTLGDALLTASIDNRLNRKCVLAQLCTSKWQKVSNSRVTDPVFNPIQNRLNGISLNLRWNRWWNFISTKRSWLFPDKFALETASILSGEHMRSALPSETAVEKVKQVSNFTSVLPKREITWSCVSRYKVLSSFYSMKSLNVNNVA